MDRRVFYIIFLGHFCTFMRVLVVFQSAITTVFGTSHSQGGTNNDYLNSGFKRHENHSASLFFGLNVHLLTEFNNWNRMGTFQNGQRCYFENYFILLKRYFESSFKLQWPYNWTIPKTLLAREDGKQFWNPQSNRNGIKHSIWRNNSGPFWKEAALHTYTTPTIKTNKVHTKRTDQRGLRVLSAPV